MPLTTHEGSGMGNSEKDLRRICKGATFGTSMAVHDADAAKSEKAASQWAKNNIIN